MHFGWRRANQLLRAAYILRHGMSGFGKSLFQFYLRYLYNQSLKPDISPMRLKYLIVRLDII